MHLSIECKIAEPRVSGKLAVIHEGFELPIVTAFGHGATKSAAPVGKSVGKAQKM